MKKVTAIICGKNPNAEQMKEEIVRNFGSAFDLTCHITQQGTTTALAAQAADNGVNTILAVGGDGTINEIVNGIVREFTDISILPSLAVIPFGTGNDLARTINADNNYAHLIEKINNDDYIISDVASAAYKTHNGVDESRYYVNICDIGLGPSVISKAERLAKKLPGSVAYTLGAVATMLFPPKINIRLTTDDFTVEGPMSEVCVANGKYFGGGYGISPYSEFNDGLLDIVYIKKLSFVKFLAQLHKVRLCKFVYADKIFYRKTTICRIESIDKKQIDIEIDGELVGTTPLEIKILSSSLKIFVDTK